MLTSLRFRLTLIFVGLAVGPLILVSVVTGLRNYASFERQSLALQRGVTASVGGEISAFIEERKNELVLLDHVYGLGTCDPRVQQALLSNLLRHQRAYQELALLDSEGQERVRISRFGVIMPSDLENRAESEEFLFPATRGKTYFSLVHFDEAMREPLITLSLPLFDPRNGDVAFVLAAELRFRRVWDLLAEVELPYEGDVYVVDPEGWVVAHKNSSVVLRGTRVDISEADGYAEGLSGTSVIVARDVLRFGEREFMVVAEQPVSSALKPAIDSLRIAVVSTSVALVFAIVLVVLTTRRVVRPIEALATSARAISSGDFSLRVRVSGQDEIGQLAFAFDQMANDLEKSRARVKQYTLELEAKNEQLRRDIAARVQAEEALRESEQRFRSVIEQSSDGIVLTDERGAIVEWNRGQEQITGLARADVLGQPLWEVQSGLNPEGQSAPAIREQIRASMLAFFETGQAPWLNQLQETLILRADGARHIIQSVVFCIETGKGFMAAAITRDITERKRAAEELERYREHLEELVRERTRELEQAQAELLRQERLSTLGQLTATVAHEIRNPLGTVRTAVFAIGDAIERNQLGRVERARQLAERNILRCDRIISELLDYTRERALDLKPTRIDAWLDKVLDEQTLPEEIVCTRELVAGVEIPIDGEHLRRAVINVVNNAVDALKGSNAAGDQLTVRTRVSEGRLEMQFSDTGCGIPGDVMDRVFEPLFSTKSFGVGLGMPIVRKIMQQHGGGVEIESRMGQPGPEPVEGGTTVTLWLPIADADCAQSEGQDK